MTKKTDKHEVQVLKLELELERQKFINKELKDKLAKLENNKSDEDDDKFPGLVNMFRKKN